MINHRMVLISGALFNWIAGGTILFALPLVQPYFGIAPVPGNLKLWSDLFAAAVIGFGVAYFLAGVDLPHYRPFVGLGAALKFAVVGITFAHFFAGNIGWQFPALTLIDCAYAFLFIGIMRQAVPTARS